MLRSLLFGLTLPAKSARLIATSPTLLFWSVLPVLVTAVFYVFAISYLQGLAQGALLSYFTQLGWSATGWIAWSMTILLKLILIVLGALTFTFASSIIASPLNDILAEKAEYWATPALPPVTVQGLSAKARLIMIDVAKTIAAAIAVLITLLISWVPIVNFVALACTLLLVTFQFTSYPQTRRGIGLGGGLRFISQHKVACLGFGASISFLFAIPVVAVLVLPVAVVGGTLLVARAPGTSTLPRLR